MRLRLFSRATFLITLLIFTSTARAADPTPNILIMGDSLLATHSSATNGIANTLRRALGSLVNDRSVAGARMIYRLPISGAMGLNIGKQYREGPWDWIVLSGGGNDLWLGCGCNNCERRMNRLISKNGARGEIPKLISRLQSTGARIVYVGYLRSPGVNSPIESCKDEGEVLEARIQTMARNNDALFFLTLADLVPHGDRTFHTFDMIHPSRKASAQIGTLIAKIVAQNP